MKLWLVRLLALNPLVLIPARSNPSGARSPVVKKESGGSDVQFLQSGYGMRYDRVTAFSYSQ